MFSASVGFIILTTAYEIIIWRQVTFNFPPPLPSPTHFTIYYERDKQCTYNVALWRVSVNIIALEMQQCVLCR